jgi:hypothetical protein
MGLATAACNSFFEVERPGVVDGETIDPVIAAAEFANSAYQNMLVAYGGVIIHGAWLTNEARVGDTYPTRNEFGRRSISARNSTLEDEVWFPLGRAMATSQEALENMEALADKDKNLNVARAALASGFTLQFMAETMCTGVIDPAGAEASTQQILARAAERFKKAEQVAATAYAAKLDTTNAKAFMNAAKVGLGRAYLQAGKKAEAAAAVAGVPADFVFNAQYVDDPANRSRLGNRPFFYVTSRVSLVTGPEWRAMADAGDPRITYQLVKDSKGAAVKAQDGELDMYKQLKFAKWDSPIRLASGLEARYIAAEAGDDAAKLALINERRAAGKQTVFASADSKAIMMELMEQRGRDFWLEGKRLGDWRRQDATEDFPHILKSTGQYYKPAAGAMGNATCIPLTEFEKDANPSFPKK